MIITVGMSAGVVIAGVAAKEPSNAKLGVGTPDVALGVGVPVLPVFGPATPKDIVHLIRLLMSPVACQRI